MGKKEIIVAALLILLSFAAAFYFSVKERWYLADSPISQVYKSYNQGRTEYSLKQFPAAEKTWLNTLVHEKADERITRRSLFNLGNNAFRESIQHENSGDLKTAIEYTQQSILRYRDLLSRLSPQDEPDYPDSQHNLALARLRLKFLKEKLRQQQKQEDQQKTPYQLLNEIIQTEQQIAQLLNQLDQTSTPSEKSRLREQLIELQKKNTDRTNSLKQMTRMKKR